MGEGKEIICQICSEVTKKTGRNQKYCKECAYLIKKERNRFQMLDKRRKIVFHKHSLGTTDLFEHKCIDFGVEYRRINYEIKKLGFKRQFS